MFLRFKPHLHRSRDQHTALLL
ncbi:protein of unknown function (plasmid) [Azospirillum baldaniorum]|uniref:Uncharacterized protein n=1 Tax=Azospirillum baldaniorum TaxID=1064539 RepID=A0A9P1JWG4_9PROT|nr:protein of unknown function [Azospirillum baldaniorum]